MSRPVTDPDCALALALERWPQHPNLVRGSYSRARLTPVYRDGDGIVELAWQPLTNQRQDLRIRPLDRDARQLAPRSIHLRHEAELGDLTGESGLGFESDANVLAHLDHVLPDVPFHPTILLNAHLAAASSSSSSSSRKSRIATEFDPAVATLNRTNVLATAPLSPTRRTRTRPPRAVVWRTADAAYRRPTAVGFGTLDASAARFTPHAHAVWTVPAPIDQLDLVRAAASSSSLVCGVRSAAALDLVHLAPTDDDDTDGQWTSVSVTPAGPRWTVPRTAMADFALGGKRRGCGERGRGLLVDVDAALYAFGFDPDHDHHHGGGGLFRVRRGLHDLCSDDDGGRNRSGFARVRYSLGGDTAVVAAEDRVVLYDLRSPTSRLDLVGPATLSRHVDAHTTTIPVVTALLDRSEDDGDDDDGADERNPWIETVCTTRDVLWVDRRMASSTGTGGEVLRWQHDRVGLEGKGTDRTLTITELPRSDRPLFGDDDGGGVQRVALSSRIDPRITVFTTGGGRLGQGSSTSSRSRSGGPPLSLLDPYELVGPRTGRVDDAGPTRFARVGLSISRDEDRAEESDADEERNEGDMQDDDDDDDKRKRDAYLRRIARRAEREERARQRPPRWTFLELGMDGQLVERKFGPCRGEEEEENEDGSVGEDKRDEEDRSPRFDEVREVDTVRLDMTAIRDELRVAQLVAVDDNGEGEQGGAQALERANDLLDEAGHGAALTALELVAVGRSNEDPSDVDSLLRPTAFIPSRDAPLLSTASDRVLDEVPSFLSAPATSLRPFASPTSRFHLFAPFPFSIQRADPSHRAALLRKSYSATGTSTSTAAVSLACDRAAVDLSLASEIRLARAVEPDEPSETPNEPQPATEPTRAVHLSYVRPAAGGSDDDDDHDDGTDFDDSDSRGGGQRKNKKKKQPRLTGARGAGTRLLLAEWHIGADPRAYAWSNPYAREKDGGDVDDVHGHGGRLDRKGSKKHPAALDRPRAAGRGFPARVDPSSSSSSQTYFPSLVGTAQSSTAASQPVISVTGPSESSLGSSQFGFGFGFGGAQSQIVPGAFGSRTKDRDKKKTKKRVSGF
ncbi:hypothetical protein JCM11491_006384 [Sporobolomyces phaffii]